MLNSACFIVSCKLPEEPRSVVQRAVQRSGGSTMVLLRGIDATLARAVAYLEREDYFLEVAG